VQAEQGVALGWYGLVDDLLASGGVVQALDITLESERGYWLRRGNRPSPPEVDLVAAWLTGA
jgi:DNA-binding transcriptional LysR family regulator